jgi:hypothetical protein
MIVDGKYYDGVTRDSAREILRALPLAEDVVHGEEKK